VIGVVKDFHFKSLHEKIDPVVFSAIPNDRYVMALRIKKENMTQTLSYLKKKWKQSNATAQPLSDCLALLFILPNSGVSLKLIVSGVLDHLL